MNLAGQPSSFYATTGGTPQNGAWYSGQEYENGTLSSPGQINSQSNQQGAGQMVSKAVVAQTNPNNVSYLDQQNGGQTSNPGNNSGGGGLASPSSILGGNQPAIPNLQGIYDTNYTNNADVKASQTKIDTLNQQLTARQQALDTATGNINDNPFYAEATRVGKVAQLNNDAQNDMKTLTDQITTEQNTLAQKQAQAQYDVNLAQGQYTMENQQWQQNLTEFNTMLSAGGLENASPATLAQLSVSTGIPQDMLQSVATSEQAKNTQIVTSTDNNGNVTLTAVNATNGKIINTTSLGAVGAAKTGGSGSFDTSAALSAMESIITGTNNQTGQKYLNKQDNISPSDYQTLKSRWLGAGGTAAEFDANFGSYADTNRGDFQNAYGFKNPNPTWSSVYSGQKIGSTFTDANGNKIKVTK